MRSFFGSLFFHGSCSALAVVGVAVSSTDAAEPASPWTSNSSSVVGDFAVMTDLEPLSQIAALRRDDLSTSASLSVVKTSAAADTQLRSSVPAANRSQSLFGTGEVFANSAAVLPLLVADLEPPIGPVSRPLSGRLVGARPSLPINRSPLTWVPLSQRTSK
jgi:hypothetical protein